MAQKAPHPTTYFQNRYFHGEYWAEEYFPRATNAAAGNPPIFRKTARKSATSTTLQIPVPTGTVEDDVIVAVVASQVEQTISPPDGTWTAIQTDFDHGIGTIAVGTWWKLAGAAESGTYDFTVSSSTRLAGGAVRYDNIYTLGPVTVSDLTEITANSVITTPSVTTTTSNSKIIRIAAVTFGIGLRESIPTAHFERFQERNGLISAGVDVVYADITQAATGATGTGVFTFENTKTGFAITIALTPTASITVDDVGTTRDLSIAVSVTRDMSHALATTQDMSHALSVTRVLDRDL